MTTLKQIEVAAGAQRDRQYLQLQRDLPRQRRKRQAVTKVMQVRRDSARAAIARVA